MALKNDSDSLTKELKAAFLKGRNFVLSIGGKPKDGFLALSKKKIPQSETKAAKSKTKKKVFQGSCFKEGSTFVFETPVNVTPALKTKLKQMIKEMTAYKVGKFEFRCNPDWKEGEFDDESGGDDGSGKKASGGGGGGGGGSGGGDSTSASGGSAAAAVEEPPVETGDASSEEADQASGATTTTSQTGETEDAPSGDVNPFSGEADAATAPADDLKGKTPEEALKALRKKIDALKAWGDKSATKLKKDAKEIEELIAAQSPEVSEKLKKLQKKLRPVYAEYQKQKPAKAKYDKKFPALKRKHDALVKVGSDVPTFEPTLGDVAKKLAAIEKSAKARDFVDALTDIPGLEKEIGKVTDAASEAVRMMIEYEARLAAIKPRLDAAISDMTTHEQAREVLDSIKADRELMLEEFDKDDYSSALYQMEELEVGLARAEAILGEARKHKEAYEKKLKEVEPRVKKASDPVANSQLVGAQTNVKKWFDIAKLSANDEEYSDALDSLEETLQFVVQFETRLQSVEADKKKYESQLKTLTPRVEAIRKTTSDGVKHSRTTIEEVQKSAEDEAKSGDYAAALASLSNLEGQVDVAETYLKELDALNIKYDERLKAAKPRIDKAAESVTNSQLESRQKTVAAAVKAMKEHAKVGNYSKSLFKMDDVEVELAAFETLRKDVDGEKAEYDARIKALKPRWAKVATWSAKGEDQEQSKESIAVTRGEIEDFGKKGDFDSALELMDEAEATLTGLEKQRAQLEAREKTYKTRLKALKKPLDDVAVADAGPLEGLQKKIAEKEDDAKTEAADGNLDAALDALDWLDPNVKSFLEQLKTIGSADAEAEYKKRIKPWEKSVGKALRLANRRTNERLKEMQKEVDSARAVMEKHAKGGKYDKALSALLVLEADLTGLDALLTKLDEIQTQYETRSEALKPNLDKAFAPTKNTKMATVQTALGKKRKEMEDAATEEDFETALMALETFEEMTPALLEFVADMEKERQEYEKRLGELEPRIKSAEHPVKGKDIEDRQARVKSVRETMKDHAAKENFDTALAEMDLLEVQLAAFERLATSQSARKADYEKRLAPIEPRYKEALAKVGEVLKEKQDEVKEVWGDMEKAANAGTYDRAIMLVITLDAYLKFLATERRRQDEDKKAFDKRLAALKPRMEKVLKEINPENTTAGDDIPDAKGRMDPLVKMGDYTAALDVLAELEADVASGERELKEVANIKAQCEKKLPGITKRVKEALKPVEDDDYDAAHEQQEKITEVNDALQEQVKGENWFEAIAKARELEVELDAMDVIKKQVKSETTKNPFD